jgi:hypothetical protein
MRYARAYARPLDNRENLSNLPPATQPLPIFLVIFDQ